MSEVIALRYVGDGAYRPSLPARDLDHDDIAAVAAAQKRTSAALVAEALDCGLYRPTYDVEPEPVVEGMRWEEMTKAQLIESAVVLGVEINPRATNAVIRDVLAAASATLDVKVSAEPEPVVEVPSA